MLVSLVFLVEVPTVLVKLRLETCAVLAVCSRQPKSGGSGIKRSTLGRSMSWRLVNLKMQDTNDFPGALLPPPPSQPPPSQLSSSPVVTRSPQSQKSLSSFPQKSSRLPPSPRHQQPSNSSKQSVQAQTSRKSLHHVNYVPARESSEVVVTVNDVGH